MGLLQESSFPSAGGELYVCDPIGVVSFIKVRVVYPRTLAVLRFLCVA